MAHFDMLRFKNNNHSASVRVIKMASSPTHSMFIVSDGSVYALGSNHVFQCGVDNVAYLHNIEYIKYFKEKSIAVKDVACGSLHTMFLARTSSNLF
jgi:alpha-tubulin suppressor-like RCC1 family protein